MGGDGLMCVHIQGVANKSGAVDLEGGSAVVVKNNVHQAKKQYLHAKSSVKQAGGQQAG